MKAARPAREGQPFEDRCDASEYQLVIFLDLFCDVADVLPQQAGGGLRVPVLDGGQDAAVLLKRLLVAPGDQDGLRVELADL